MTQLQRFVMLVAILIGTLINVSKANRPTKSRLCNILCCSEVLDLNATCDKVCNECKKNHSVGGVCELRTSKNTQRGCNKHFTCDVTCRNECSVRREDDESRESDFGSGDHHTTQITPAVNPRTSSNPLHTDESQNLENDYFDNAATYDDDDDDDDSSPPVHYESTWGLTELHIILIIVAVSLFLMIVFVFVFLMINERRPPPVNNSRGQYPPSVFYTGKMATISQGFNQPSTDFSNAWR
ncbi:uncharacterized protein [Antedon mediterranea]|uniref:uncharacterized protein n=1 Tax=Antedon mediterranea TaxID=105859 RepID=UPI003AF8F165